MSVLHPLPRSSRRSDLDVLPAQVAFGPVDWLAFDPLDVAVFVRAVDGIAWVAPAVPYTVTLDGGDVGFPVVTFDAMPGLAGSHVRIEGRRVHGRTTDVTRAAALVSAFLEREEDLQALVLQELRRDIDDANVPAQALNDAVAAAQASAAIAVPAADRAEDAAADAADWAAVARNNFVVRAFAGNGATVAFDLGIDPGSANNCFVTVNGAPQRLDAYSVNGTILTFTAAPAGDGVAQNIEVRFGSRFAVGTPADGSVSKLKLAASSVDETKIDPAAAAAIRTLLGIKPSAYVSAHKNGTSQTTITAAVKVTFTTEARDTATWYDAPNSRLQPNVACTMAVRAVLYFSSAGMATGDECLALIRKNGATIATGSFRAEGATGGQAEVSFDVEFNGSTDYVEIFAQGSGSAKTVLGGADVSYLQAKAV